MAKQFLKECKETRGNLAKVAGTYDVSNHLELRTEIDSLLIMYDQLCERVRLANADTGENNALLPDVSHRTCDNCKQLNMRIGQQITKHDRYYCEVNGWNITDKDTYCCNKWEYGG